MAFLKLHTIEGTAFIINMNKVDEFRSDGAGHTEIWFTTEASVQAKESFEEVEELLEAAMKPNAGVISKQAYVQMYGAPYQDTNHIMNIDTGRRKYQHE